MFDLPLWIVCIRQLGVRYDYTSTILFGVWIDAIKKYCSLIVSCGAFRALLLLYPFAADN